MHGARGRDKQSIIRRRSKRFRPIGDHEVVDALELGGDCLADIAVVRAEPAVFGLVASDPERSPGRSTRWPRTRGLRYSIGFTLPDETADLLKLIPDRAWTPA